MGGKNVETGSTDNSLEECCCKEDQDTAGAGWELKSRFFFSDKMNQHCFRWKKIIYWRGKTDKRLYCWSQVLE